MSGRAVLALGFGQLVNWGVLYYAFVMLVVPLERELDVPTWVVTGAFSLALLTTAAVAPAVGRWGDRGRAPFMMQAGGMAAAALLVAWTCVPGVLMLYLVWAALGGCMAATLYEPAFVIVGRAFGNPAKRLQALATVTLFGGLASTAFLPVTAFLVRAMTWRGAVLVLALLLVCSTGLTRTLVFAPLADPPGRPTEDQALAAMSHRHSDRVRFIFVVAPFALASLASAGFAANLVPALGERGATPGMAAMLGGVMGVTQLPGRALLIRGAPAWSPGRLVAGSLLLHAFGLGLVAVVPSTLAIAAGTMIFGLGAGLTTLIRPHLIQTLFNGEGGGVLNGRLARHQQLARAAGPLAIAWWGGMVGYATVFAVLAGMLAVVALVSHGILRAARHDPGAEGAVFPCPWRKARLEAHTAGARSGVGEGAPWGRRHR